MRGSIVLTTSLLLCGAGSRLFAAPTITSIANAASNKPFNAPIAQGAVFVIKGSGLGPASLTVSPTPFQTTNVSGTSIAVTVGSTTVNALMYYASDGQVAALLPSNTPTGTGAFTVTYNSQTSPPGQHGITVSNFGILTLDSSGQGPAIVSYPDFTLVSTYKAANCGAPQTPCGAANPGDTLTVWGTGMGPVSGDDASGAGLGQNMPAVPVTVWLGGVQAPVSYQGRSGCCVGLDQIVFKVPDNAATGCAVPLVVQIGTNANTISNTGLLPVAKGSRTCTPTNPTLASLNLQAIAAPVTFLNLQLEKDLDKDIGGYSAGKIISFNPGMQPYFATFIDDSPLGTCVVYNQLGTGKNFPGSIAGADAGSSFTVKGPNGSVPVAENRPRSARRQPFWSRAPRTPLRGMAARISARSAPPLPSPARRQS